MSENHPRRPAAASPADQENDSQLSCPKCGFVQPAATACQACGIIFDRIKIHAHPQSADVDTAAAAESTFPVTTLRQLLLTPRQRGNLALVGSVSLWLLMLVYGLHLVFAGVAGNSAGESVLHLVNLPFHEAGHVLFRPFGSFMTSLGGTLGQLLVPLVCGSVLLLQQRDPFGAVVGCWWLGENLLDIAPYIDDARAGVLPLVGGNFGHASPYGFHDWEYLLTETGLLGQDHLLARLAHVSGGLIMLAALLWGGWLLVRLWPGRRDQLAC